MTGIKLIYNPYFLKTELFVENVAVTSNSPLAFIFSKAMHKWLEPSGAWKGFFAELVEVVGEDKLKISFIGTAEDFDDLEAAARPQNIELEYLLEGDNKIRSGVRPKLQSLVNFLKTPLVVDGKDFLADIRPALTEILSDKSTINIIATFKNFSAQNIFYKLVDNPKFNFVVNESNQNFMFTFLKAFADVKNNITLFVFNRETLSSQIITDTLRAVTQAIGQNEYAQTIYESLFFVCTDCTDERDIKNILKACGFDKPKLFMVNSEFINCRETLSAADCKNFLCAPISSLLKANYTDRIKRCREVIKECMDKLKFYALYTPDEIKDAERRRDEALNEIALINSNIPALEQTILTYTNRYVLFDTVRKIYLGVKKKLRDAERDMDKKIFDTSKSLQELQKKITSITCQFVQENPYEKFFDTVNALHFDNEKFELLSSELFNKLTLIEIPAATRTVEKNLIGHTDTYLKLSDAQIYSQIVANVFKEFLFATIDEINTYLAEHLLTPVRNIIAQFPVADQNFFQDMLTAFAKAIGDKTFDLSSVNFNPLESYEAVGRDYAFVKYVSVNEILSNHRIQAERLLKEQLRKFKILATKFVNDFHTQAEEKLNHSTPTQNTCNLELQQLQRAVTSKTKNLTAYTCELDTLKNFDGQLDRLLEINL